ncbi:nuclear transport factor 2 family protein [Planomonospora sp. ID67723]|uniref:nuclear transport factor 2 family protein n=1 Tax=Planomonospora sp. ID67723 TaxID=2738134 RepID=UPI0018C43220|nr:nuclear transport factor 2 family protein [Planomonospora sp. ID67723]
MGTLDDRFEIIDVCTRLVWHTDRREWDLLASVFAEKVMLDYTSLDGGEPVTLTPGQIVGAWSQVLGAFDATQHLLGNHLVTTDGDTAVCTASFQATHRLADPYGSPLWTLGGTYRFDLVRTAAGWKIAGVVMTWTWADGNRNLMAAAAGSAR